MKQNKPNISSKVIPVPGPISQGGFLENLTGTWRYLRPRYEEKLAPCIAACPAGERAELWIRLLQEEKYDEACRIIKSVNPFPRVSGRVCFHPCESECNRGQFDRPIAIHALERFVGDQSKVRIKPSVSASGKKIGVIGSGPAGLTCAFHLALLGHAVTVYEAEAEPGGLLRYGIPAYRLPKDVLQEEVDDILSTGIELKTGTRIEDLDDAAHKHDAVFVAVGYGNSRSLQISGESEDGVIDAIAFLKMVNSGQAPSVGNAAIVIGGGNAAVDAARTAVRLGADTTIVYRRSKAEMPAYPPEVEEAQKEGVTIRYLTSPTEIIRDEHGSLLLACVGNRLGEPDESGRRRPEPIADSQFVLQANTVISAVGEAPDGRLVAQAFADEDARSLKKNVFIGGDLISPNRTVAYAIGSGRRAAVLIHASFGGSVQDPAAYPEHQVVKFESLNMDYFRHRARVRLGMLSLAERKGSFAEVSRALGSLSAAEEAARCFHCGACISCDNCRVYCPDVAVKKLKDGYAIDYDYCKGCGICVFECPRNAMSLDEEERS